MTMPTDPSEIERLRAGAGEPRVRALQAESGAKLQMEQERHATERQHSLGDNGAAASAEPAGGAARCTAAVVILYCRHGCCSDGDDDDTAAAQMVALSSKMVIDRTFARQLKRRFC